MYDDGTVLHHDHFFFSQGRWIMIPRSVKVVMNEDVLLFDKVVSLEYGMKESTTHRHQTIK